MSSFHRRKFLSLLPGSVAAFAAAPLIPLERLGFSSAPQTSASNKAATSCWLDVCAPFIVENDQLGIHTEIVLTSDTFVGVRGYSDREDATDYEIYLYDAQGRALGTEGIARKITVSAMDAGIPSASANCLGSPPNSSSDRMAREPNVRAVPALNRCAPP